MFRFKPQGKTLLEFCTNLSCALHGADDLIEKTCKRLGVQEGGTTEDGRFTVTRVECLAACGGGPALQVNGEWVENATEDDLSKILSGSLTYRPFEWPKSPGEPVLLRNAWKKDSTSIDVYKSGGGYANLEKHLSLTPDADHRAGEEDRRCAAAAAPASRRASSGASCPRTTSSRATSCVNADESEPGTFKDRLIIENDPHQLLEACVVSSPRHAREALLHLHPRRVPPGDSHHGEGRRRSLRGGLSRARTSSARASTSMSWSTAGRAPTSAARRRRCSRASRASAASRGSSRRSPRPTACTAARRSSTTSRPSPACR